MFRRTPAGRPARPLVSAHLSRVALLAATLLALVAPVAAPAVAAPTGSERSSVAASARPDLATLDRALVAVRDAGAIGITAEVVDGRRVWRGALGSGDLTPQRPAREDARFRAASVTKMLVSVLALQLVEKRVWTLDTTIGDVLPALWPERSEVTLGQLLSHTSGAPEYLTALLADAATTPRFVEQISRPRTDTELVAAARSLPWSFEPGTSYGYSNTNYVIVGMMLRRQTGRSMPDLMERRVLRPAGMTRSEFAVDPRLEAPALKEYAAIDPGAGPTDLSSFSPTLFSSAGALVSTARDLNRFQAALSSGRLLRPATVRLMRSVVGDPAVSGVPYGYGSYRLPDPCVPGGSIHGHDGGSFATVTLSFASEDGRRRVTLAMTGRQYTLPSPALDAALAFVTTAVGVGCGTGTSPEAPSSPTGLAPAASSLMPDAAVRR